jgi:hypothetical protein
MVTAAMLPPPWSVAAFFVSDPNRISNQSDESNRNEAFAQFALFGILLTFFLLTKM